MQVYLSNRDALVNRERALRFDHQPTGYTDLEKSAVQAVKHIEFVDHEEYWTPTETNSVHACMPFGKGKNTVQRTRLFNLIRQMPKGALLHGHTDAMSNSDEILQAALSQANLLISSKKPLTEANVACDDPPKILFDYHFPDHPETKSPSASSKVFPNASACSTDYILNSFVSAHETRRTFPGGPERFDNFVKFHLNLPVHENSPNLSVAQVWDKFESIFLLNDSLINYEPVFKAVISSALWTAVQDNISWLELRTNFFLWNFRARDGTMTFNHARQIETIKQCVEELKQELASQGKSDDFYGVKLIYCTLRIVNGTQVDALVSPQEQDASIRDYMEDCLEMKRKFPDLISGFDLVGHEDKGITLRSYLPDLLWFKERQLELGLHVPYFLHAGETLGDGNEIDHNLYDAILLGTKRIGHGFSAHKHPKLLQLCKENGIMLEVCPISNEILQYTLSTATHPLPVFLNNDVPVCISSDDPQMFGNHGLSFDFYEVIHCSDAVDIVSLGKLSRKSLEYSEMDPNIREKALRTFDERWENFLHLAIKYSREELRFQN